MNTANISSADAGLPSTWSFVAGAFRLYRNKFGALFLIGALPSAIAIADFVFNSLGLVGLSGLMGVVSIIISLFYYPALFAAIFSDSNSSSLAMEAYKKSGSLFGPYVVIISLMLVAIMGGFLLLIIPAIYVAVLISLAPYAWIAEGKKGKAALTASWNYVKGKWWKIFWKYLAMAIVLGIIQGIVTSIFSSIFPAQPLNLPTTIGSYNIPQGLLSASSPQVALAASLLSYLFSMPLTLIFGFLVYKSVSSSKGEAGAAPIDAGAKSVSRFIIFGIIALILLVVASLGAFVFALYQLRGFL